MLGIKERPLFSLGKVVCTRALAFDINEDETVRKEVEEAFNRYILKDWGDLSDDDKRANDRAVETKDDRVLAEYKTSKGGIYIITEECEVGLVTTLMYKSDY